MSEANPVGRPTLYDPELTIEKSFDYLWSWETLGDAMPQIAGLACHIGVSRKVLYEWQERYPEFRDVMEKILAAQERVLFNKGLNGSHNSTITKLALVKHGYRDQVDSSVGLTVVKMSEEDMQL